MSRKTYVLAVTAAAALAATAINAGPAQAAGAVVVRANGTLVDFWPATWSAFDGAEARVTIVEHWAPTARSGFTFHVSGVEAPAGTIFGAHLHVGPCVAGAPRAAGDHYNIDALEHLSPPRVGPETEVWLDVTIDADGSATATAHVPFVPLAGARSIVVHAVGTDHVTGGAGTRLACLPVDVP